MSKTRWQFRLGQSSPGCWVLTNAMGYTMATLHREADVQMWVVTVRNSGPGSTWEGVKLDGDLTLDEAKNAAKLLVVIGGQT